MPVYAKQYGRLGNNLFQKAAAIGYAMKHGLEYNLSGRTHFDKTPILIQESAHNFLDIEYIPDWRCRYILLNGYWQSEKYFAHCREEVLKAFGYPWEFNEGWCSIHVRRGDYLKYPDKHPVINVAYLNGAMNTMIDYGCNNFIFFSDDIRWCMSYISDFGEWNAPITVKYSEGRTPEEDLIGGSCCEHNIISNSSFSWWQAWLNQNPDKVVISPSKDNWFGPDNAHLDTSDLIPDSWIQIKY